MLALAIGLPLGAWTARSSIEADVGVGAIRVGEWSAWPLEGSPEADPYTKARVAARGSVPLGVGEGVAFHAIRDADGVPLDRRCNYHVVGRTPKARVWTLTAHEGGDDTTGAALMRPDGRFAALTSRDLVRKEDASFSIAVGPTPTAGDWIPLPMQPPVRAPEANPLPLRLALRFYDSPVGTSAELIEPTMPRVERTGCAS